MSRPVSSSAIAMPGKNGEPPMVWLSLGLGSGDLSARLSLADAATLHKQLGVAIGTFARAGALASGAELQVSAGGTPPAADGDSRYGLAPEGTSGASAEMDITPANASPSPQLPPMPAAPKVVPASQWAIKLMAPDRGPCRRCGVPGFRGCDHYAPFVPDAPPPLRPELDRDRRS